MAKQKSARKPGKSGATRASTGSRARSRARKLAQPSLTPQQELLYLARGGARSLQQTLLVFVVIALVGGAAYGLWSLRPTPSYASDEVATGSPFDVTFRAENTNPWFALSNLRLSCVLAHVRASTISPTLIEANEVRFPAGTPRLEPGESATFKCPFRAVIGHSINDDSGIATRSEIYFRSEYDLELFGLLPIRDNSARFFLNTRLLPPRWTSKPPE